MSRSARLRAIDLRAVAQLAGECRDLGDDAGLWRRHLMAGLARLTGAGFGLGAEMSGCVGGPRKDLGTADWGWENGFDRAGMLWGITTFQKDPMYSSLMNAYMLRLPQADGSCLARTDMITDRDWYQSCDYLNLHRVLGADATLVCFRSIPGAGDEFNEVFLVRARGERDFSRRDRVVVAAAQAMVTALVGGPLARFADPAPSDLAPRARAVLRCVLEGDSDKQVAARLGIQPHTVNTHTKIIYRHFGVKSRSELLARWIRRGWGGRFAWDDPPVEERIRRTEG